MQGSALPGSTTTRPEWTTGQPGDRGVGHLAPPVGCWMDRRPLCGVCSAGPRPIGVPGAGAGAPGRLALGRAAGRAIAGPLRPPTPSERHLSGHPCTLEHVEHRGRLAYRDREAPPMAGPICWAVCAGQLRIRASTTSTTAVMPSFTISRTSCASWGDTHSSFRPPMGSARRPGEARCVEHRRRLALPIELIAVCAVRATAPDPVSVSFGVR